VVAQVTEQFRREEGSTSPDHPSKKMR
jgi:hypothetical protein